MPVGTGAFEFDNGTLAVKTEAVANKAWWGDREGGNIDRLVCTYIADENTKGAPFIHWLGMTIEMEKLANLNMMLKTTVSEITENGVRVKAEDGTETEIPADNVIVGAGMKSLTDEAWALYNAANNAIIVGDAQKPARMNEAIAAGYYAGFNVQRFDA